MLGAMNPRNFTNYVQIIESDWCFHCRRMLTWKSANRLLAAACCFCKNEIVEQGWKCSANEMYRGKNRATKRAKTLLERQ